MNKISHLLSSIDFFAKYTHPNEIAPTKQIRQDEEEYDERIEKLRNPGQACGGICTIILVMFVLYEITIYSIKLIDRETLFSEKLYIADAKDKDQKFDTETFGDSFNPGFGFRNTKGFGRGNEPFDPLDNDYV